MSGPGKEGETICTGDRVSISRSGVLLVNLQDPLSLSDCMYHICSPRLLILQIAGRKFLRLGKILIFTYRFTATACLLNCLG